MKTYYLEHHSTKKKYEVVAQNKTELRKLAFGKLPDGWYSIYTKSGSWAGNVNISERSKKSAEKKRNLPKAEYDQLYFYVTEQGQDRINEGRFKPVDIASPRRYDTLKDVLKSALAKSYKNYKIVQEGYTFPDITPLFYIYKGNTLLGMAMCSPFAKPPYKGSGTFIDYRKGDFRILKDGTLEKK